MTWRAVWPLLAAATLGGCATLPTGTDGRSLDQRRDTLQSVRTWEMRGRLTVDTGDRAVQGRFNWRQDGDALDLTVRNPLGAGILRVMGQPDALTVTARGETRTLTDPEAELSELIGWWLPVASLPDWLLGFPDRGFRAVTEPGSRRHARLARATALARRLSGVRARSDRRDRQRSARAEPHRPHARRAHAEAHDRRLATGEPDSRALNGLARAQHNIGWGVAKR